MRIKKIGKKGMSHIEMVLSFVMFVSFLVFLFAFIKPFKSLGGGEAYLDVLKRGIINYTSVEVNFLTLKLNEDAIIENCFYFKYNSSLDNISARNENYEFVEAFAEEKNLGGNTKKEKERKIYINSTGKFFYIYFDDEFVETGSSLKNKGCTGLEKENYSIGLFRVYNMTSFAKLENLTQEYNLSYTKLKENLGLPATNDFSFSVRDTIQNNIVLAERKIPAGVKVMVKDTPIQIAYTNGSLGYAILNIRIW